ncbi:pimeloyl-ACP methyl ester carboxylesterase [Duganella sp. 1224]|uniref:alpha/beta fold hydrolase n=1 Tax=Duganella sp. 1224 TaxID=2587052 RepID=UPI0015CB6DDA|nr:alpha/beta hydrolase [Duganella sp. 1224]NYE62014.1 pimeloyl-ACP methyl ester carboxylesterase [Duganella sp. 1224]
MKYPLVAASLVAGAAILFGQPALASAAAQDAVAEARLQPGEHEVTLNGLSFHYTVKGKGPVLVVQAPGWGIGSAYLRNGLAPLEEQFTVLTYDTRGSGQSSHAVDYPTLNESDMADDLERLRRYWQLPTLDLIGHSNGGAIAIAYAERYPDHVHKLMLVGTQLIGFSDRQANKEQAAWRRADPRFKLAVARFGEDAPKQDADFTQWFRDTAAYYVYDPVKDGAAFLQTVSAPLTGAAYALYTSSAPRPQVPPLSALPTITAQTLMVVGRQDPVCPVSVSEKLRQEIAGSRLLVYENTGHFPWIEQSQRFFSDAASFFR